MTGFRNSALVLLCALVMPVAASDDKSTDLSASARMIAQKAMIVDTHIDVPYRLIEGWEDVTRSTDGGEFDYERARKGGLNTPFMSIYIPAHLEAEGGSYELANRLIDSVEAIVGRAPGKFTVVKTPKAAEEAKKHGLIGLAMGMENGSAIEGKLENLQFFGDRGISYITLTHGLSNHISDSSYDENRQWHGLSPFGREVVAEMNRLGIMVDISHVSDEAFYHALEISRTPVIASHSSLRHFTPGWERNMSDEMLAALAANGGVIQIAFGSGFISQAAYEHRNAMQAEMEGWQEANAIAEGSPEMVAWMEQYFEDHPYPYATISDIVDHFDRVVELVGIDHVGIGSDFDGVGPSMPRDLRDVSYFPALIEEFMRREYSLADIEAILGGNLMRVWGEVEMYAKNAATGTP